VQLIIFLASNLMKQLTLGLTSMACALVGLSHAQAQEQGRVISSTPVIQQVAVPRQVCTQEQIVSQGQQKSGGGAVLGAVIGGVMGNAMGRGSGRVAATGAGILAGAVLGDKVEEGQAVASTQNVQRCSTQTFYENRTLAYNVVYEFNGKQYQVQMPQDPGPFVGLQVTPVAPATPAPPVVQPAAPAPVIVRPVTQAPEYVEPVVISSYSYVQPVVIAPPPPVWVRPAPVYVAPAVVYRHPHRYPHGYPYYGHPHRRPGAVVNIRYHGHGHWR
jgi:uncharacterized protein YcfJ